MFDWFWNFLYTISSTIFRLVDGLILCANKLCGIETINFEGEETDFMSYLIFSDEVGFAFRVSALLATILLVIFTVFMIIRSIAKDKAEGTPTQIAVKSFKTILMFFLVPALMLAFMMLGNIFVKALYSATVQSAATPGTFLFCSFAQDGGMSAEAVELFRRGDLNYAVTSDVSGKMILSNFPFLFSWIAGGVVLYGVGSAMLIFVDRVLSLVILYIAAPISLATSVLDDGARFKLWRDQFLSKFIMGYGMIIAINIYALICGLIMKPGFAFFVGEDSMTQFLDLVMKLLIIAGGALTLQKSMALVGNLVSSGAGSNELRDMMSVGSLAKMATGAAMKAAKTAFSIGTLPLKPAKDILSSKYGLWVRNKAGYDNGGRSAEGKDGKAGSGAENNEKANYGSNPDSAKSAINNDPGFKTAFTKDNNSNTNTGSPKQNNTNSPVTDAIQNNKGQENQNNKNNQGNQNQGNPNQGDGGDRK